VFIPVLEDALERSLRLAAAMDSRGYGRTGTASRGSRRVTAALMLAGMCGLCAGVYGLLDGSTPELLGLPTVLAGSVLCGIGLAVGSRQVRRTQYRPDPWKLPEWMVVAAGMVPAVVFVTAGSALARALSPSTDPLVWPTLPALPTVAILVAAIPAVAAPQPLHPPKEAETPGAVSSADQTPSKRGVRTFPPAEISA
jgi:energy-coupling factor transport system permease protein